MNRNTKVDITSKGSRIYHFFYLKPTEYDPSFKSFIHLCKLCRNVNPCIVSIDRDERNITIEYLASTTECDRTLAAFVEKYEADKANHDSFMEKLRAKKESENA